MKKVSIEMRACEHHVRRHSILLAIFLFITVPGIWAQNGNMPHVSQIAVETRNNLIRLTWVDSPEARGHVYIFRSVRPFTDTVPANIRPVVIRYGTQYFIDDIDDLGNLYYFIAASDTAGRRYDIIIPQTNSTEISLIQPDPETDSEEPPAPVMAVPEPTPIEGLSNLKAILDGDKVTISFDNSNPKRSTILYRSAQPIRRPQDLLNAVIVQPSEEDKFEDYPVPGTAWYYALIYEDEVSSGNIGIDPGVNTTISAVIVTSEQITVRAMRHMPLPELVISNYNPRIPLGSQTVDILRDTQIPPTERIESRRPRVFAIDLQAPAGGEDSALFQIIKEHFEIFDWETASINLYHFLSLPRSKEVEARARFYLGQSLYFTGNYRQALLEFLAFRSYNQVEANIWIDAVLAAMVN